MHKPGNILLRFNDIRRYSRSMKPTTTLLLSVLLAFVVWFIAIDQENPMIRREYEEPILIEVRNIGAGLQSVQDLTNRTAMLTLRAPQRSLESQQADDFTAIIDLAGLTAGNHEVEVEITALNPDVEVIVHEPRQLRVQLEPVISRIVPVEVEVMDSPAVGYDWQEPLSEPAEVEISGPRTYVMQVRSVVAQVFLRNAKSQVEQVRPLSARNSQNLELERVEVEPSTARIVVPVVQPPGRKEVVVRADVKGLPSPNYRLTGVNVDPQTVVLLGSPSALREVPGYVETTPLLIEGAIDDVRERLPLILPENVSTLEDSVFVTVGVAPLESSLTVTRHPVVQGAGDDMRITVSLEEVEVIVSGPLPRLELLGPEEVRVLLDLTGLLPGSHLVQPTVVVPEGIVEEGIIPEAIEVLIESLITPTATETPEPVETPATPVPPSPEQPTTPEAETTATIPAPEAGTVEPSPVPAPEKTEPPPTATPTSSN
jgi:YbbR domain-containing protein